MIFVYIAQFAVSTDIIVDVRGLAERQSRLARLFPRLFN